MIQQRLNLFSTVGFKEPTESSYSREALRQRAVGLQFKLL